MGLQRRSGLEMKTAREDIFFFFSLFFCFLKWGDGSCRLSYEQMCRHCFAWGPQAAVKKPF